MKENRQIKPASRTKELENEVKRLNEQIASIEERYRNFFQKGNDGIGYIKFEEPIDTSLPQKDITEEVLSKKIRDIQLRIASTITGTNTLEEVVEIIEIVVHDLIETQAIKFLNIDPGFNPGFDDLYSVASIILNEDRGVIYTSTKIEEMIESGMLTTDRSDLKCLLGAPVATSEEKFGVLMVLSDSEMNTVGQRELNIFEIIGRELAIFIKKNNVVVELIKAREKAEEANRVKSNFLANMSHELRTPLQGIMGYAELVEEEVSGNPDLSEMVQRILRGAKRLHDTVGMILEYSNIETKTVVPQLRTTNIIPLLKELFNTRSSQAAKKGLNFKFTPGKSPVNCAIDLHLFNTMFNNIIDNAIKFTLTGKVELMVSPGKDKVEIKVSDTGIGISSNEMDHIWGAFRQASEGVGRDFEGNGLGLTVAKRFAELMSASIEIESEPGMGTVVTVTFPVAA